MNINKVKFPIHSQKNKSVNQKTQQFSPYTKNTERRFSQKGKELILPLQKLQITQRDGFRINKPLKSEGRSLQKQQAKHGIAVDLVSIKNSILLKKQRESLELVAISKKKSSTNRMATQKLKTKQYDSTEKYHQITQQKNNFTTQNNFMLNKNERISSVRKFLPRHEVLKQNFGTSQVLSGSGRVGWSGGIGNIIRLGDKVSSKQKKPTLTQVQTPQKYLSSQIRKTSNLKRPSLNEKKITQLQKQQMENYDVHFVGNRRIQHLSDFTDSEGQPKVFIGDSIAYKYQIVDSLGRGSFGKVFKAFDHKKKQYVALKIIKSQAKFTNQAKIQVEILQNALLHDPKLRCNLVRMKNSFNFRGHACITFEILHKNLYQFLKESNFAGFSQDLIRRFGIQILQTLLFFTHFKIIHCDLKPENILLKQQNKSGIKVIDVGSGCFQSKQLYTYIQSRFYRAPQIILGIKYTSAIDIWSFGCILIQLYTGFPLFPGQNQNQQILMFMEILGAPPYSLLQVAQRKRKFFNEHFQCKIPQEKGKERIAGSLSFKQIIGQCDPDFIDLISRCLEWDPKKRITPKQALLHKWIVNGLPTTIRNQHVQQINNYTFH